MEQKNEYQIDRRTEEDLRREISRLAASYTPEWAFRKTEPDAGSVIGLIFANQMAENIRKINLAPEKYRTEFVNMLNLSLRPAYPASGIVTMELIEGTIPGTDVPKGTRLLGSSEDGRQIVFETVSDVHITNSKLRDILSLSGKFGKIVPVFGGGARKALTPEEESPEEVSEEETISPFSLFDYDVEGIERNALLLYHENLFDTAGNVELYLRAEGPGGRDLSLILCDPKRFRWSYYGEEGLHPFDSAVSKNGAVVLKKSGKAEKLFLDNSEYTMICVEALCPVTENIEVSKLLTSSECGGTVPDFVYDGSEDLEPEAFHPFGDIVSIFDECFIGCDQIFSQYGAMVSMKFHLSVHEKLAPLTQAQEREELKVIKRRSRTIQYETARTSPQRVVLEYFNGTGWKKLACEEDCSSLFDGTHAGDFCLKFRCPQDWRPVVSGGYEGRSLRFRVTRADDCYLRPCIHTMPELTGLSLSYTYFGDWKQPQRVRRLCGTTYSDLTALMLGGRTFAAFSALPYVGNALYLGFDHEMTGSPVSILFDVEESVHFSGAPLRFEYSTLNGFEPLKIVDHTRNMSEVGTVLFLPPSNFARRTVEGRDRFWIRIVDEKGEFDDPERYHPVIRNIMLNAVEIRNIITAPEEEFYIDAPVPNMQFQLSARNILRAEVFVSEKDRLSLPAMREMLEEQPQNIRVKYDFLGNITEFYVRWTEVDNFDYSKPGDRHYMIDRMDSTIHFGDGVSVMIPTARRGPAFSVTAECCDGEAGNLPPGAVSEPFSRLLYVSRIDNPMATYAGTDIESIESAHARGANLISSKGRLVSEIDFTRAVKAFSSSVDKVKCVVGRDLDGREGEDLVSIAVMMRDYAEGPYSFNSLRDRLYSHLMEKCEATLSTVMLSEPVYVEISVCIWAETEDMDHSFEIQEQLKREVTEFLDPVTGGSGTGWPIGVLPEEAQIFRMIHSIDCGAVIRGYVASARYTDRMGVHERSLDELHPTPFMIGVSGTHTVYMKTAH